MKYVFVVLFVLISLFFVMPVHAQEINDPDLPIVRCAGLMCTDPIAFFEYKMFMPMIGGN